jgi:hypothetical protein
MENTAATGELNHARFTPTTSNFASLNWGKGKLKMFGELGGRLHRILIHTDDAIEGAAWMLSACAISP